MSTQTKGKSAGRDKRPITARELRERMRAAGEAGAAAAVETTARLMTAQRDSFERENAELRRQLEAARREPAQSDMGTSNAVGAPAPLHANVPSTPKPSERQLDVALKLTDEAFSRVNSIGASVEAIADDVLGADDSSAGSTGAPGVSGRGHEVVNRLYVLLSAIDSLAHQVSRLQRV